MWIRTFVVGVLSVYAFFLTMRHNVHMFQLNGYKNDEHVRWIRKNLRQQWLLGFGMLLGVVRMLFPVFVLDVVVCGTLLLIILVYRAMRRLHNKKKLVFTARVCRMIATIVVVSCAVVGAGFAIVGKDGLAGIFVVLVSAQVFLDLVVNVINAPIEACIRNYYVNDAKKKLKKAENLKVIGITGSYGKTSMKFYLQTLLQSKFNVLATPGNFNTPLGITITVRKYLKPTHEIFLCEMGARRVGEIKEVCDIAHPDLGIITSIGPQHLETFHSMENIQKTKFELADALPSDGRLFLNGDNDYVQERAKKYRNEVFYYSEKEGYGYCAKDVKVSQYGTEFTVVTPDGESERYQTKLIGAHNVINVVGAISVAHTLGMTLRELRIPVRKLQPVEHRMQMREHGSVTIIDDAYNSNPVGSKAAVETLAMFDGIRILITPGMVELGESEEEFNYRFGEYAADCCDYVLLVGKNRTEPIRNGVLSKGFSGKRCLVFDRLDEAISYAYSIKGQGHKYILLENDLPDNY